MVAEGGELAAVFEAVSRWATRLIDVPSAQRLDADRSGLQALCVALGAARGLYFGFRDGDTTAVVQAEWKSPDLPSAIGAEYTEAEAGGLFSLLRSEQIIACFVDGEEPELAPLRAILEEEGLVADLIVPVAREGVLVRAVVIDFMRSPPIGPEALRSVGEAVRQLLTAAERRAESGAALREELQQQAHRERLQSLGTMAGGILHDVNNVFQIVTGLSELLLEHPDPEAQRGMVSDIGAAVGRGAQLCHRLLLFSRQGVRPQQTFRLDAWLQGMGALLRAAIPEDRGFALEISPSEATVVMPVAELEHALINLCNNAVDATVPGDRITVSCRLDADGEWVRVAVSDTGKGMGVSTLERAQEAFYTTKPAGSGTGLGLAMVRRAITEAGGTVTLQSEEGSGTTVTLCLPTSSTPAQLESAIADDDGGGRETLLVVEDDAMILRVTASALRRRGYTVLTARNGSEVLPLLDAHGSEIDLVISDVVMPELGGVALQAACVARGLSIPFLFTTGYDAGQLEPAQVEGGSAALLLKPYTSGALQAAVRGLLD